MKQISTFADRLKEYMRLHEGMTYDGLSKLSGENPQTLNRYALGQRIPKIDSAVNIALKLGVSPMWLQGFDEPMYAANSSVSSTTDFPDEEKRLLFHFHSLNSEGRQKLLSYSDDLISSGKYAAESAEA